MAGETTNNSGQQLCRGLCEAVPYLVNADEDTNNFCLLTGEEFSMEFLHDRVALRKDTDQNQPGIIGFNHNQSPQIIYQDPAGINGLRRKNSECNVLDFVPGTAHGYQVENRAYLHSISRNNMEYSHNGSSSGRYGGEMTAGDRVASGTPTSPKFVEGSSQLFQPFETGFSGNTFSEKMKLLCSFGGRILPRPNDGKLRYVGGETRIISIRKNIRWEELAKKTSAICNQSHTIKYQLPGEDLDALISVSSDEDLHHMTEEYQQVERGGGSQRLRIFLVPTSEPESPNSCEGNAHRQTDSGYQYVIAVNGMVDFGLAKNYSEQSLASQTTQFGSALDYSPSFARESPSTVYLDSPTSSRFAGTLSNPAAYFFTPHRVQGNPLSQSPPLSPVAVQDKDYTNSKVPSNSDTVRQDGDQSIRDGPMDQAPFDRLYCPDGSSYYNNIAHVPLSLINNHQPLQYKVESDLRTEALGMPFHNRSPSGEFPSYHFLSQSHLSSDRTMERTYSGSRLEGLGKGSKGGFEDAFIAQSLRNRGREKSPSLVLSKSSKEGPNQREAISGEINQVAKCENKCNFKTRENINFNKEALEGRKMAPTPSKEEGKQCEGYNNAASDDKVINGDDLKDLEDRPCVLYHYQQDSQELTRRVGSRTVNALEDSEHPKSEHPHFQHSSSGDAGMCVQGQLLIKTNQSESVVDQPVTHMLPRTIFSVSEGFNNQQDKNPHSKPVTSSASSRAASLCDGVPLDNPDCKIEQVSNRGQYYEGPVRGNSVSARHSQPMNDERDNTVQESEVTGSGNSLSIQSQPLKGDRENIMLESVIIVEDVTGEKLPDILAPSTVVPLVEEEPADDFHFDGVTDAESTDVEFESEIMGSFGRERDELINDATMAEIEAGIYGLQIIKNSDIEEMAELGSGTFGAVYHGKWRGTDVAIKRIKDSCFSGRSSEQERLIKDFWREARILSTLHHPNVLAFYGLVPDGPGGTMATVTEYVVDGSLRRVLQRKGRALDRRRKLAVALDAAFGMEYLHMKDIIHFDLKCDNLLVNLKDSQRPICKVADFGLSKIKRNTFVSGGVRGTLPWMAPELLDGSSNRVSEKVDVYSFGIVMWEIQTGEEPYADMHCGAIIGGIVSNTLRPTIPENCDPEWRTLMEECWSSDPDARPSFTEITKRLRAMLTAIQPKRHNPVGR